MKYLKNNYFVYLLALLVVLAHQIIFQDFFPNKNLRLGHDYALFLPQFIFRWIQEVGNVSEHEMHRTFNMGCGMIIIISNYCAEATVSFLSNTYPGSKIIGEVRNHGHKVTHVHPDVVFDHY